MNSCIIHFGLPKTGTTSIQRFLRNDLTDQDFYYPAFAAEAGWADDCHNRALSAAFQTDPREQHDYAKENLPLSTIRARGDEFREHLRRQASSSHAKTLLLSAEDASWYTANEVWALHAFLQDLDLDTGALAYVRPLKQDQESRFQQALREPGVQQMSAPRLPSNMFTLYKRRIEYFDASFGRDRVKLLPFATHEFEKGCVVRDFCRNLGIRYMVAPVQRTNESLSLEAVKLLYCYRRFGRGYGLGREAMESNRRLVEKLLQLKGPRFSFHSSILTKREKVWRGDLDWISERMGRDMQGDLQRNDDGPCLRSEKELLEFSKDALAWLAGESGVSGQKLHAGDPQVVADAVGMLRQKSLSHGTPWRQALRRLTALLSEPRPSAT